MSAIIFNVFLAFNYFLQKGSIKVACPGPTQQKHLCRINVETTLLIKVHRRSFSVDIV